ncbi:Uncharacterised protein [Legionella steigerwaltii]|uniref:Uncharacterized protein n=1 Tax=Legionella steigerwaltii TaxID=460 RepID=A0A378LC82_9GAMM|nr:hypothetical protein Lstg_0039 [Legionella steigerwaltii]STY23502.1 Uncharacterised protein [Legionella steigerwaltii]
MDVIDFKTKIDLKMTIVILAQHDTWHSDTKLLTPPKIDHKFYLNHLIMDI